MLTYANALDDVRAHLLASWKNYLANGYELLDQQTCQPVLILPKVFRVNRTREIYTPELSWERILTFLEADNGRHTARFEMRTTDQTRLDNRTLGGVDRYRSTGIIIVDLYYSRTAFEDKDNQFLAPLVRKVFARKQTHSNMVKFKNARIGEQTSTKFYFRTSIFSEFEFDELMN